MNCCTLLFEDWCSVPATLRGEYIVAARFSCSAVCVCVCVDTGRGEGASFFVEKTRRQTEFGGRGGAEHISCVSIHVLAIQAHHLSDVRLWCEIDIDCATPDEAGGGAGAGAVSILLEPCVVVVVEYECTHVDVPSCSFWRWSQPSARVCTQHAFHGAHKFSRQCRHLLYATRLCIARRPRDTLAIVEEERIYDGGNRQRERIQRWL